MPLIILTGFPTSGKSTRALQLKAYFESQDKTVNLISENELAKNMKDVYSDPNKEKELRSSLKSQLQRVVGPDGVTVLDGGNYIKGYRYELYCISKESKTTQCTVHCDLSSDSAWTLNESKPESLQYDRSTFEALIMRYEMPDSRNRWDKPLFTIHTEDELPLSDIFSCLYERKAPPPNLSTQSVPLTSTNFLYELDCVTQEIVNRVVEAQKMSTIGQVVAIPNSNETILLKRRYQLSELSRIRRQFITFSKTHPVDDIPRLASMFTQYLTSNLS